jgi:hypothetical protein
MRRFLLAFANFFVVAYALDAGVSVAESLIREATGLTWLGPPRNFIAGIVVVAACLGLPLLALTPKLPISVFLPLILSALWFLVGAPPVASFADADSYGLTVCAIQLAFAVAAMLRIRSQNGGDGWLFRAERFAGPLYSARYTLVYTAALVVLAVPLALLSLASATVSAIEFQTAGFVTFDSHGVSLDDRRFSRDGREIRLVGMMHFGEPDAYREIFESFATESTLILAEGISDDHGIMDEPISYDAVARTLGLEQQQYVTTYLSDGSDAEPSRWPEVRRADLDASDFAPETIEGLERIGRVWADDSPLLALLTLVRNADEEPAIWESLVEDILNRRNETLVAAIDATIDDYDRIVVPWGALHLPAIEEAVRDRGFERVSSVQHRLISWATLFAFLLDKPVPPPG